MRCMQSHEIQKKKEKNTWSAFILVENFVSENLIKI